MTKINDILADIINSIMNTTRKDIFDEQNILGMISVDHGNSIFISQHVEHQILKVADRMYEQDSIVRETHLRAEWRAIVRYALGQSLNLQINNHDCLETEACKLKKRLREKIEDQTPIYRDLKTAYGCWLFTPSPIDPIEIGPVRIEDKLNWLKRTYESRVISKITYKRLSRAFTGKGLTERKPSRDAQHEETIRRQISNAPMVCEVMTHGLARELACKRSMIATNLALTSISLIWPRPSSILKRFRTTLDGEPHFTYDFFIAPERQEIVSWQWTRQWSSYHMEPKEWKSSHKNAGCFLKIAGEMIDCWASTTAHEKASPLLRSLSQALFFFWKACQESSDILSIVEFVAAMESLAHGRNRKGIFELIEARLGLYRDQKLASDKTVNQIINGIYRDARSESLHGANSKLHYDWSNTRDIAEQIARGCLVECMIMAQDNWRGKDKCFLLTDPIVFCPANTYRKSFELPQD